MEECAPWIGFDLDGTLAEHATGRFRKNKIGPPVPRMVAKVLEHLQKSHTIKIFTARVHRQPEQRKIIQHWLMEKAGLPPFEVTCEKDPGMQKLYDDRAVQVEMNTGKTLIEE